MFRFQLHAMPSPLQRLPGRVTFEWPAMARRWLGDGVALAGTRTPEAGWDLNGFVVCVCDAKQSTDSMIWQGYTKTTTVQQWLQMAKTRRKYIHLKAVTLLPSNFSRLTQFPFPVIHATVHMKKFVKRL